MKKIKNSQLIVLSIIISLIALFLMFFNYFISKKEIVYSKMNLRLFESEQAKTINKKNDEQIENNTESSIIEDNSSTTKQPTNYEYIGLIEIPKINFKKGFLDLSSKYNNIKYNVTVVNTSLYPDVENGNLILAAHAGNAYNSYFGRLHELVNNDIVYIYYNNIKYEYSVVNMYEIKKTGYADIYRNFDKTTLTLITCKDNSETKQIVYILELTNKLSY